MNHLVTPAASPRSYAAHDSARAAGQFTVGLAVLLHHSMWIASWLAFAVGASPTTGSGLSGPGKASATN